MSAGDIDDRILPDRLRDLRFKNHDLDEYIESMEDAEPVRASVPFTGGISDDGTQPYVDENLRTELTFDGQTKDVISCIVKHEVVEWGLREFAEIGIDYSADPRGHRMANCAELQCLYRLFGATDEATQDRLREAYDDLIDPQVRRIEHMPVGKVPADLAMYPYEGTKLEETIREAQYGTNP